MASSEGVQATPLASPTSPLPSGTDRSLDNPLIDLSASITPTPKSTQSYVTGLKTNLPRGSVMNRALWSPSQGTLIAQKASGIAFFHAVNREKVLQHLKERPTLSRSNSSEMLGTTHKGLSTEEISSRSQQRLNRAESKRLQERTAKKSQQKYKQEWMRHRVQLQKQRDKLNTLRKAAKTEYNIASASLKRQMLLRERIQRQTTHIVHVENLILLKKLRQSVELRRSVSATFAELLSQFEDTDLAAEQGSTFHLTDNAPVSPLTKSKSLSDLLTESAEPLVSLQAVFGDHQPPITRFTLRELDIKSVLRDWQVRHDMWFDPNLSFQVNNLGARGEMKQQIKEVFWHKVMGAAVADASGEYTKILVLINEMKAIILELAPWEDHFVAEIEAKIDIKLIDQQLAQKSFDYASLLTYVASTLKLLCAPCRDDEIAKCQAHTDAGEFLLAFKHIFHVLELMKLDIINRNLLKLRPWVVEQTAEFELDEFQSRVAEGSLSTKGLTEWIRTSYPLIKSQNESFDTEQIFTTAVVQLVRQQGTVENFVLPETFNLDKSRLQSYWAAWEDYAIFACIMMVLKQALGPRAKTIKLEEARKRLQVLIDDSDTCMDHMSLEICQIAGNARNKPFTESESQQVLNLLNKTLAPGNPVYDLMLTRIGLHLAQFCRTGSVDEVEIAKQGLDHIDFSVIGNKIRELIKHNKMVYATVYSEVGKTVFN